MKRKLIHAYRAIARTTQRYRHRRFFQSHIEASLLKRVTEKNRRALELIDDWLPDQLLEQSVFRYGINPDVKPVLNLPLNNITTHADLLAYFGQRLQKRCRYLELGVSVGKTIWQILHTCAPCECWGFDIEEINPVLRKQLVELSREEFPTPSSSIKHTPSSLTRFRHEPSGSTLNYIAADIYDPAAWNLLQGKKFNVILSDALHSPEALALEWEKFTRLNLFDPDEIIIMWDDLDGEMHDWFIKNREAIASALDASLSKVTTIFANGWLGSREYAHRLGLAIKANG